MVDKVDMSPLIVVLGETASGKSALAMTLAEQFDGALICADSRTVYRGMDIGTAKPTSYDRQRIQHYCLDLVNPNGRFTAADFKSYALGAMEQIRAAGKVPILVGGTGLYIDAVIYDYEFRGVANMELRQELYGLTVDELLARIDRAGIETPANSHNPRHLIRALETGGEGTVKHALRTNTLVLGLTVESDVLQQRITDRVELMCRNGLEAEARHLAESYGWNIPPMQTIGYQEWRPYFAGKQSKEEMLQNIISHTVRYAKRQRTWFRRNKSIHWFSTGVKSLDIVELVTTHLNK